MNKEHNPDDASADGSSADDAEMLDAIAAAFGADALEMLDESVDVDPTDTDSLLQAAADLATLGREVGLDSGTDLESVVREIDRASMDGAITNATPRPNKQVTDIEKIVVVELGDSVFGIPMVNVHEIQRVPKVTLLPNVPNWVLGVANLRGNILSVVDLRLLLGMAPFDAAPSSRRLVVTQSLVDDVDTGFIVDRVIGIRAVAVQSVAPPTAPVNDQIAPYLTGVVEVDDALVAFLDIDKLMLSEDFRQFEPL